MSEKNRTERCILCEKPIQECICFMVDESERPRVRKGNLEDFR